MGAHFLIRSLDRGAVAGIGVVETVRRHAVDVDPVLEHRSRKARVIDLQARPGLAG